jgi:dTDP-4-amino-4,6-dideoxygalactose transaminase
MLAHLRSLPPVGEPIRVRRLRHTSSCALERQDGLVHTGSGTAALAHILQTLATRARESGSKAFEVLIPAYGCPDIVSAVAFAGLRARLVDLDGPSPFPSPEAWCAAIDANTIALVTVGFLGLRDPFTPSQACARGLPAGSFIEDCCQVHPLAVQATGDRSIVLSFGRGKPVSVMHGGAAVLAQEIVPWQPALAAPKGVLAEFARVEIATRLYNVMRSPWLYGWVRQLPGLGVGQTAFVPLDSVAPMNGRIRERLDLSQGWRDPRREALQRLFRQRFLDLGPDVLAADLWRAYGRDGDWSRGSGDVPSGDRAATERPAREPPAGVSEGTPSGGDWLLRYPLLLRTRAVRELALSQLNDAGLGASAMYAMPLESIPGVRAFTAVATTTGAAAFADRLLTLPLHADVEERDVRSMCEILSRVTQHA